MRSTRFLLPLLALAFLAAAHKPKLTIRFHIEANANSGSSFAIAVPMPGSSRTLSISKVADISESDVAAIFPFPAEDGSMGCALKLDNHGQITLASISQEYRGTLLLGFVNGRAVTAMLIDRKVLDGVITIPRGLTPAEIALMKQSFPTLGEKKSGKKKATAQAPAESMPVIAVPPPLRTEPSGLAPRGD
ncbi:MAG: hypothetical protein WCO68_08325 [Verrucomicrobiota bacterium]